MKTVKTEVQNPPKEQEKRLGTGFADSCKWPCGFWEPNVCCF